MDGIELTSNELFIDELLTVLDKLLVSRLPKEEITTEQIEAICQQLKAQNWQQHSYGRLAMIYLKHALWIIENNFYLEERN